MTRTRDLSEPPFPTDIRTLLKQVELEVADVEPICRPVAYEVVLSRRLSVMGFSQPATTSVQSPGQGPAPGSTDGLPIRFTEFLEQQKLMLDDLANLYDAASGEVISRDIGAVKSEGQRKLAAVLSIMSAQKTGEFRVSRDAHNRACKLFGVEDSANYAYTMRNTQHEGVAVFVLDANRKDWIVTRPGQAYVATVAKSLLPRKKEE
jgi:hypothetical protein